MRLLILAEADLSVTGSGAERVLAAHVEGLARAGHAVAVITGSRRTPADDATAVRHVGWSPLTPFNALRAATAILDSGPIDAVIAHHAYPALRLAASPKLARVPLAYVFHSPWHEEFRLRRRERGALARAIGEAVRRRIERRVIRRVSLVLPLSEFMAGKAMELHGLGRDVVRVVPGGVDRERFAPVADRVAIRRRLGLPATAPVVFSLRNLEPRMGLPALLRALPAVLARYPDAVLVLGGSGPLRGALEALAGELGVARSVIFRGFVPEDELRDHYAAADVFALPSEALEGFGLVTLEALACGTPVLGSRVGATPELLAPLDPTLLFPALSPPEAIARAIVDFLARGDRAALAVRCRAYTERYAWREVIGALEQELLALTGARPARPRR